MSSCPHYLPSGMSSDTPCFKPVRRRDGSDELDVFEATRYFSGDVDGVSLGNGVDYRRALKEERDAWKSLDPQQSQKVEDYIKNKKGKQPISPSGRLANFLNSLLHQAASKKKSKPVVADEGEESHGGRRSRNNISHTQSVRSTDPKSIHSYEDGLLKDKDRVWGDEFTSKQRLRRDEEEDEESSGESDSSSDLFELKNY